MAELAGKVVVVTGGASGNGRAIAIACARSGAAVVVADVREDPREGGQPTHLAIDEEHQGRACYVRCDVTDRDDLEAAVEAAERYGGIDVLVSNAGILRTGPLLDANEPDFDAMMAVNVRGVYFGAQAAARRMVARGSGVIVNVSSIAGMRGTGGYSLYNMTKGAVRLLTMSLADELGPSGIRVVAVHPGIVDTHMNVVDDPVIGTAAGERYRGLIPLRRWGRPEEVADAVVYLASDRASYVSGTSLIVDGGYLRI